MDSGGPPDFALVAQNGRREARDLDSLPCRPYFQVEGPAIPEAAWLFVGPPDASLRRDVASVDTLTSEHTKRLVPIIATPSSAGLDIKPAGPLQRGEVYSLAIGGLPEDDPSGARVWELKVAANVEACANVIASWPAAGSSNVPPQISQMALAFDGPVTDVEKISMDEGTTRVPAVAESIPCEQVALGGEACVAITPEGLAPETEYTFVVSASVKDAQGGAVGLWTATFQTGRLDDNVPFEWVPMTCAEDETPLTAGCLFADDTSAEVRLNANAPFRAWLKLADHSAFGAASRGEITLQLNELLPGISYEGIVRVADLGGRPNELPIEVQTAPTLPTLSITEVRTNPNGAEPAQEYVELYNYGPEPIPLTDFTLSDSLSDMGDPLTSGQRLAPNSAILVVADAFDPNDDRDTVVPPGVQLVRIGPSLGASGLANRGEPLFLRDTHGQRISATPPLAAPAGQCLSRSSANWRSAREDAFTMGDCTPGTLP